jgi:hypothetical protein
VIADEIKPNRLEHFDLEAIKYIEDIPDLEVLKIKKYFSPNEVKIVSL